MLSRFHPIPERYGQTDRIAISIWLVLTRDKNCLFGRLQNFGNERYCRSTERIFCLMHFGLWRAAPFVSSPIHLFQVQTPQMV